MSFVVNNPSYLAVIVIVCMWYFFKHSSFPRCLHSGRCLPNLGWFRNL